MCFIAHRGRLLVQPARGQLAHRRAGASACSSALALFILKFEVGGVRPGLRVLQRDRRGVVKQFLEFTDAGSQFVFGVLADRR